MARTPGLIVIGRYKIKALGYDDTGNHIANDEIDVFIISLKGNASN